MCKSFIWKILKGLSFLGPERIGLSIIKFKEKLEEEPIFAVPEDVMEGHFAVVATKGEETQRFIVKVDYLTHPDFLTLLDQARQFYGLGQKGALELPCRPHDLQQILEHRRTNNKRN